ncbi:diguanylate cyclase [Thiomicrorhabdus arctica]|uniref:diguanylate cyclase n=1 Tax=Thiomicrorhabdus arctica TaxID=131540 RepID=UPI0003774098|nr:diguanylate cyclase [Thiomicrorhabdus arctica]
MTNHDYSYPDLINFLIGLIGGGLLLLFPLQVLSSENIAPSAPSVLVNASKLKPVSIQHDGNLSIQLADASITQKKSDSINRVELTKNDTNDFILDASEGPSSVEKPTYLREHTDGNIDDRIDWALDEKKDFRGLVSAYLSLMGGKAGFEFVSVLDYSHLKIPAFDVLASAVETQTHRNHLNYIQSPPTLPMVLANDDGFDYIALNDPLNGRTVAVIEHTWLQEGLTSFDPEINAAPVDSITKGLLSILDTRTTVYSNHSVALNYANKPEGLSRVWSPEALERRFKAAMDMQNETPYIYSILENTLVSVTETQRQQIYENWVQLKMVTKSYRWLYGIALILLATLIILLLWMSSVQRSKKVLQSYIDTVNELSLATVTDNKGLLIWVSDSFTKLSGYDKQELIGQPPSITKSSAMSDDEYNEIYQRVKKGETWRGEVEGRRKDGSLYCVNLTAIPEMRFGKLQKVTVTREDLTDRKKAEELSIRDSLTGLYNRRYFTEVFEREIKRAQREDMPFVFAMADIDFFKNLNDHYGHQQGDVALQKVSNLLQQSLRRPQDLVFRLGGEEFGMILNEIDLEHVNDFLRNVNAAIKALGIQNKEGVDGVVTLSCGAIILPSDHQLSSDAVFKLADDLMYQAKENGRNRVEVELFQ